MKNKTIIRNIHAAALLIFGLSFFSLQTSGQFKYRASVVKKVKPTSKDRLNRLNKGELRRNHPFVYMFI